MDSDKRPRGFAAMDKERHREIAQRGGRNVPPERRSFAVDRDLAMRAGQRGGSVSSSQRAKDE